MPKVKQSKDDPIKPYWATADGETVRLYLGDVVEVLRRLPSRSVQCCVTSPPYWTLRDYGTGTWTGGDPKCDHKKPFERNLGEGRTTTLNIAKDPKQVQSNVGQHTPNYRDVCSKCGARRTDRQLGSEARPDCLGWATGNRCEECHVCRTVAVFREVRRVLRLDGTLWLNYGDSYASGNCGGGTVFSGGRTDGRPTLASDESRALIAREATKTRPAAPLPPGNLVGVPWRVALALQADGWILRQDIIWAKPSPMPESVCNRCTKAHEYVFLLTQRQDYFCDMEAIREKSDTVLTRKASKLGGKVQEDNGYNSLCIDSGSSTRGFGRDIVTSGANKRSVWTVAKPLMKLRDDLTKEQKVYVLRALAERGLL